MKSTMIDKADDPEALFLEAEKHEERGDFKSAFKFLLRAAQLGHTGCQINVGNFYSWGKGVRKSRANAEYWYRKAYKQGDGTGAFNLGIDRRNEGNIRSAIIWFKKALALHDGEAAIELAKIHMDRRDDRKKAIELLSRTQQMNRTQIAMTLRKKPPHCFRNYLITRSDIISTHARGIHGCTRWANKRAPSPTPTL